jgi:hypothetical protein
MQQYLLSLLIFLSFVLTAQTDGSLSFDGQNDYVIADEVPNLKTSDFTVEAWVNIRGPVSTSNKIVNKGTTKVGTPVDAGFGLQTGRGEDDRVEFSVGGADTDLLKLTYNGLSFNTWHHIAGVREGRHLRLYFDGELVAEDSTDKVMNVDTDMAFTIGNIHKDGLSPNAEFLNGRVDEVRLWTIARTEAQIKQGMDCSITSPTDHLLAVYNLDDAIGLTAADSSGNQYNGSLIGGPIWNTSASAPTVCLISSTQPRLVRSLAGAIHPNPVTTELYVDPSFQGAQYTLYQVTGRILATGTVGSSPIDVRILPRGTYLLRIVRDKQVYASRLVKG